MPGKRLKTLDDLRRYMASLVTRTESGRVEATLAGRLAYMISILSKIIEGSDIEKRLDELERKTKEEEA
jgi:hypothetical protein